MGTPEKTADAHEPARQTDGTPDAPDLGGPVPSRLGPGHSGQYRWGPLALWWVVSVSVAFLHNGLWATPNLAFISRIAENLGENPFNGGGDYLLTGPLPATLARLFGQIQPHEVARLHLVVLVVGWGLVVALANFRRGYRVARTLTVVLAAAPLVTVSMQWLGQPDPLTGLCGVAMVLVRRRWSVFVLAVVAGLSHPEQALFMVAVAGAVRIPLDRIPDDSTPEGTPVIGEQGIGGKGIGERGIGEDTDESGEWVPGLLTLATGIAGVVVGRLITEVYLRISDIGIQNPRSRYLDFGLERFMEHHIQEPFALLWTLWGPLWLVFVSVAVVEVAAWWRARAETPAPYPARGARRNLWVAVGLLGAVALLPVVVTLDETRVYAVITAPLLAAVATAVGTWRLLADRWLAAASAGLLAVTALIPGGFATGVATWRGQLPTGAMVGFLATGEQPADTPDDVSLWLLQPFTFKIPDVDG